MNTEVKYCVMDDSDVEYDTPIEMTEELEAKLVHIEQKIKEKYKELFS